MSVEGDETRRLIGFVLCGSALLFLVGAVLVWSGSLDLGGDVRMTAAVLGVAGVADLALAAYFLVTARANG